MLDIKFIRENKDAVKKNCKLRNIKCGIDSFLRLDDERKDLMRKIEELKNEKNRLNEEMKSAVSKDEAIIKGKAIKDQLSELEPKLSKSREIELFSCLSAKKLKILLK